MDAAEMQNTDFELFGKKTFPKKTFFVGGHHFCWAADQGQRLEKARAELGPGGTGQRHDHRGQRCK
jgi:hypothetical protein